ncbi:hypothetical protein PybrP1_008730 [[Pythium] brassicae (nom. inval.)]|nr:hypothetical protein PybrP1_008730 [[Pythium] brassicae (nom. inval.)]
MPNTGKSHHQPHAYPAAREKLLTPQLQQQQQLQQLQQEHMFPPPLPPPPARSAASHFVPDTPLSARPFMTMVAPAPFAAAAHASHHSYQHQEQHQHQHLHQQASSPSHFPSYSSFQPSAHASSSQARSSSSSGVANNSRAFGVYERLQPPAMADMAPRSSSNPRTAWREDIEQRARAMERSSSSAFGGVKRPAPRSPISSPRDASPYDAAARSYAPSSRAFTQAPSPAGVLPTLSCVLQRNADASSSTPPSASRHSGSSSELSHHHYVSKRQRMFAPPALNDDHQDDLDGRRVAAAAAGSAAGSAGAPRGAMAAPMASLYRRSDLTDVDNDHLRSILEKEIAMYNQRPAPHRQAPAAMASASASVAASRYEPPSAKYTSRPNSIVYSNAERSGVYAGGGDADSSLAYRRDAVSPRASLLEHQQRQRHNPSPRGFPSYAGSVYTAPRSDSHAKYARSMGATDSPQQQQPQPSRQYPQQYHHLPPQPAQQPAPPPPQYHERLMRRDASLPPTREYVHTLDAAPLQQQQELELELPPQPVPARHHQYAMSGATSPPSGYDSPLPTSRPSAVVLSQPSTSTSHSASHSHSSSNNSRTTLIRTTTTTTSGYRARRAGDDDDDSQELSGEAVIEAASGLVEERSPSKRESITKLLLKSKEFLKAKSLVRNRNNEIDWVATFLNVGFESSSIYSLMCPLRKGRWKVEEEKYTMELLRLLESGTVRLRHGQSIRGFIAKKLHSDDMRVLKKLSNCKMFHFARTITPHMSEEEEIDERVPGAAAALGRLEKLRSEFLRSVQLEALVAVRKYLSDSSIRELLNGRD